MCVSTGPASFTSTILFAGRRLHPRHGRVEVLGYQNTAINHADGPNAMILHVPAVRLTQEQFVPVGRDTTVLTAMTEALTPAAAGGMDWMSAPAYSRSVTVFEHDVYTVVLADDPTLVPAALDRVPQARRPHLDEALFSFYANAFPLHTIVVCCFDNADAKRAKPLLLWYEPIDPSVLTVPAIDCHTGGPPDLDALVRPDHWVVFGTDEAGPGWGSRVDYPPTMRAALREFLPDEVIGAEFAGGALPNGDFSLAHDDLLRGDLGALTRTAPDRAPVQVYR
ncbi:hypothetical protein EV193_106337 [Herbihabitans rhizosphaerae]|uniref:Uncharacterized protein n=1 Tax=Herbihabitans rhizosphaerae TaxID=1872711 RepID=A0A4Q7KKJ3_9PSEU|nr:hypothetical protein [Herbihabitans rhizosphaerae]RZS37099.1 hypothetical protein EV193_106337 [Herbihabitans rhizosphaerae]